MADFKSILDTPAETVERPKLPPVGTYRGTTTKVIPGESRDKKTPFLRYVIKLNGEYLSDVDEDAMQEYGGATKLMGREFNFDFWMTPDSQFRFTEWCDQVLGIDLSGKTLRQLMEEAVGHELYCHVFHKPGQPKPDGSVDIYANVDSFAKAD